ncbi:hypothetical protein DVH05_013359 [Phytophthora capsici]|nr:hypothetical protein DVH05_013359 [Phytophthora capsici]|eukprot:jgi/Phyca11/508670/fgenesh2_kg.PHYCAscaffold_37_\
MITVSSAEEYHAAVAAATDKTLVACFSVPWCGGCKLVAPKVATLAEELAETVSFAKVSAEELETLCEEVEVDSFPHFRVYKAGKILGDYTSSKFDKVDVFIRGLVAPNTVGKAEEVPEGEAAKEVDQKVPVGETVTEKPGQETMAGETTAETTEETPELLAEDVTATETTLDVPEEGAEGSSKKRQEREEMESNDEQAVKKAKIEEGVPKEDQKVDTDGVTAEVDEATTEGTEKSAEEATPVDKLEATSGVADVGPADAAAA